ncbi:unnamed protein product [Rotaria socialis]
MDYLLNTTHCLCDPCHEGNFCETFTSRQHQYATPYHNLIIYITALCISTLNNSICLELFIRSKAIRRTNCGIYLIIYSILSILASIFLVADGYVTYDKIIFEGDPYSRNTFHCVVGVVSYNTANFLCIWFSASVQLERGIVLFSKKTSTITRKRSIIVSIIMLAMSIGCAIPIVFYDCAWNDVSHLKVLRVFFNAFHIAVPVLIYIVATVLSLIAFARRIRAYGMENRCYIVTFAKLVYSHLFIFIPPLAYAICYTLYNLVASRSDPITGYYHCGISLAEYIIKIILRSLTGVPFVVTWLIFVYPSRVYMTEFYLNTWCGQWSAWIVAHLRQCFRRNKALEHLSQ